MIRAVFFDLDGTLYDYYACEKAAREALFTFAARRFDRRQTEISELYDEGRGMVKQRLGNVAASHNRMLYIKKMHELMGQNKVEFMLEDYDAFWDTFIENMSLYPYVLPLIKKLKDMGIYIGLISDLTAHIQLRKLDRLGLDDVFDYITTSEEAGVEKPDERIYHLALDKANVKACEAMMIGDDMKKDIEGAQRMGMRTVFFSKDSFDEETVMSEIGSDIT